MCYSLCFSCSRVHAVTCFSCPVYFSRVSRILILDMKFGSIQIIEVKWLIPVLFPCKDRLYISRLCTYTTRVLTIVHSRTGIPEGNRIRRICRYRKSQNKTDLISLSLSLNCLISFECKRDKQRLIDLLKFFYFLDLMFLFHYLFRSFIYFINRIKYLQLYGLMFSFLLTLVSCLDYIIAFPLFVPPCPR